MTDPEKLARLAQAVQEITSCDADTAAQLAGDTLRALAEITEDRGPGKG